MSADSPPTHRQISCPFRVCVRVGMLLAAGHALAAPALATGAKVRAVHIDGSILQGQWGGSQNGRTVTLTTPNGPKTLAINDLAEIAFRPAPIGDAKDLTALRPGSGVTGDADGDVGDGLPSVFLLDDGGRLVGTLGPPAEPDGLTTTTVLGKNVTISYAALAAVRIAPPARFPLAAGAFQETLRARKPGEDFLVTKERPVSGDDAANGADGSGGIQPPKVLPGRLVSLGPDRGTFVFSEESRVFQTDRVFGIVFAGGATAAEAAARNRRDRFPVTVATTDGSSFSARVDGGDRTSLQLTVSVGKRVTLLLADIVRLDIDSDRVAYVSDLEPSRTDIAGLLHRPWPVRFDRSASGGPLRLGDRVFEKGLGVHSRTALDYRLDGHFELFVATAGIDDAVRPRGSVAFRVLGDGKTLFDSGLVSGSDDPVNINVNVTGVKVMTLLVDYGDGLDLSDHADWADARLLRPSAPPGDMTQ